jgi:hypothetical protein
MNEGPPAALEGIRVIDLTANYTAYAGRLLAAAHVTRRA